MRLNAKDNVISVENNGNVLPIEVGRSYFGSVGTLSSEQCSRGAPSGLAGTRWAGRRQLQRAADRGGVGWAHRALVYIPCCNAERSAPQRQHTVQQTVQPHRKPMRTFPLSPLPLSPHSRLSHSCPKPCTLCSTLRSRTVNRCAHSHLARSHLALTPAYLTHALNPSHC